MVCKRHVTQQSPSGSPPPSVPPFFFCFSFFFFLFMCCICYGFGSQLVYLCPLQFNCPSESDGVSEQTCPSKSPASLEPLRITCMARLDRGPQPVRDRVRTSMGFFVFFFFVLFPFFFVFGFFFCFCCWACEERIFFLLYVFALRS